MTAKVTLQPSAREFYVEPGETVLEAALRSGVSIPYNCNNGSCGDCRARIVSGELSRELPHDYVIKQAERDRGMVLLCCAMTQSDLAIEVREAGSPADIAPETIATTVYKIEHPTVDTTVLHLRTPRSKTLRFLAGQHATIRIDGLPPRNKSIASCPCNGMFLQFHIRKVPGDPFAEHVSEALKQRDKVEVEGPFGAFTLDEDSRRPIVFLAYETGFASIKSLIEHAIALEKSQHMHLYWVARDDSDHYLANYCRSWQDALDDFVFTPLTADAADQIAGSPLEGLAELDKLSAAERAMAVCGARVVHDYPDLAGFDVYASGPRSILSVGKQLLTEHGLPEARLFVDHIERY